MKIVLFTHPVFVGSQSMPRYAKMLADGMQQKGYEVLIWKPEPFFHKLPFSPIKKWLGYIDQYFVFPLKVKSKLRRCSDDTIFVFADQALGPWVPLVKTKPHVIHCHDFLALNSALGKIPENPTRETGKIYQNFIRRGFSKGKHFISISKKTQEDLHELHEGDITSSAVCYNGLNREFKVLDAHSARNSLDNLLNIDLSAGYILHVGGNQFYKNRKGVIEIYDAWRASSDVVLPLLLVGAQPADQLKVVYEKAEYKKDIHFVIGLEDQYINAAYSGATCLLFPSLDEGFGWPIAEAMACGCPVITTNRAPMTEILGFADFFLIERRPFEWVLVEKWSSESARQITRIIHLSEAERQECVATGLEAIKKFDTELFLNQLEEEYQLVLKLERF
ncbi:mannosyl transferase [Flavobacterium aquidurense]|uniref:glycosyltransferase n=1 Tax=Flavobacterium aquidurense TaxID=362413 RepID=UPI00091CF2EB|nr:glycosyltransferase [Flavobacterium aquidurense]OXA74394.1 mannosyl transferase [Flavobacterium aquidurense]SHF94885.1 Glycosyltransferase involved in cell wall bisynthesis [Flavobacterium frigidimaris]